MANVRIKLNHAGIEAIEDSFAPEAFAKAQAICASANAMKSNRWVADFNCRLRPGEEGGRRYAVVSADAPSTIADNARHNILAKVKPW